MSCSYDLWCADCKTYVGLDWNHEGALIAEVLEQRPHLEAIGRMLNQEEQVPTSGIWRLSDSSGSPLVRVAKFVAAHEGHRLVSRDEYGRDWLTCGADIPCDCGIRRRCRLPDKHEGKHSYREVPK